jgi:hypothetical protein
MAKRALSRSLMASGFSSTSRPCSSHATKVSPTSSPSERRRAAGKPGGPLVWLGGVNGADGAAPGEQGDSFSLRHLAQQEKKVGR